MGYETINVTPVTPRIGAEVDGLTLAKPLSNRQVEELHQALAEHQVLFFRDQPLDVQGHKAFGRYFGDLHIDTGGGIDGEAAELPIGAYCTQKSGARDLIAGNIVDLEGAGVDVAQHEVGLVGSADGSNASELPVEPDIP